MQQIVRSADKRISNKLNYNIKTMQLEGRIENQKCCKNHPQNRTEFFVVDQPWIKLCKECALNLALCGKKIDRDLNPREFQNKIMLVGLTEELKKTIDECEREGRYMGQLAEKVDKVYQKDICGIMKNIDEHIKELNKVRDGLYLFYQEHISQKLNSYYDLQNKFMVDNIVLKKHLENIESNYCDLLIESEDEGEQLQRQINSIKNDIERIRKNVVGEKEKSQIDAKIQGIKKLFLEKIQPLKQMKLVLPELETEVVKIKEVETETVTQRLTLKPAEECLHRKFMSHRKLQSKDESTGNDENKSMIGSNPSQTTTRTQLSLRSNSKRPQQHVSNKESMRSSKCTRGKGRDSMNDISNLPTFFQG